MTTLFTNTRKYIVGKIVDNKIELSYTTQGRKPEGRRYWTVPPKEHQITRVVKDDKFKLDGKTYHAKTLEEVK